jgi:putative Ca2+/H+ antiporter (TMEM165/GDT1 family)
MEALLASFGMVAIAEIGDKTQLLSFVLAARFAGRHGAIIAGILVATIANHLVAAYLGGWAASLVGPDWLRWILGLAFLAFAVWALIPDTLDDGDARATRSGAFVTATVLFFLAEMGDKTQLATIALGAQYGSLIAVTAGTTLGMMAANVPAVLLGEKLAQRYSLQNMRFVAAALFAIFGLLILLRVNLGLGLGGL